MTGAPRVGVMRWEAGDGLGEEYVNSVGEAGCIPVPFLFNQPLPKSLAVILVYGPFGSLVPLGEALLAHPAGARPRLVWFITEQLPPPAIPHFIVGGLGRMRHTLERAILRGGVQTGWIRRLAGAGLRFRYVGDILWLGRRGLLDRLVTGSPWRAARLRRLGVPVLQVPSPSHYPGWGADLGLARDIPVLWLGKPGSRRRRLLLARLEADLRARGIPLLRVDGEAHPYVFGEERTRLLNRTKIVVNLLRERWDNTAMRYGLAAMNGAMIVSEPTLPHTAMLPGVHYAAVPAAQMAERIAYFLAHEAERAAYARAARALVEQASRPGIVRLVLENLGIKAGAA
jgi:hypothetical protein